MKKGLSIQILSDYGMFKYDPEDIPAAWIYSQKGYFNTVINLLEDPSYVDRFNDNVSPIISNLLWLSENAIEIITENESVDSDNTYYPVLCFLASKY